MAFITIPNVFVYNTVIDQTAMNANFTAITAQVNGGLDNTNISGSAAIALSKLSLAPGGAAFNKTTTGGQTWGSGLTTDTQPQITMTSDAGLQFGPGGSTAVDVRLKRSAANTLQLAKQDGTTGATLDMNQGAIKAALSVALYNTFTATITPGVLGADRAITFPDPGGAANLYASTAVNHDLVTCNGSKLTGVAPGTAGHQLVSNGTDWIGVAPFKSTDQTITAGGTLTLPHSLGYQPTQVWMALVNVTNEANYTTGQVVYVFGSPGAANTGCSIIADATNLTVRYGSAASTFSIPDATSGANTAITNADWHARFFAI